MSAFTTKKITSRRSLGSTLKAARRRLEGTLEQAEANTKIPLKYLQALEEGEYQRLPAEAYNIGYVRSYAEYLRLQPAKIIQLYREERSQKWHQVASHSTAALTPKKVGDWQFLITPKLIGVIGMVILFGSVTTYIASELRQFTQPPKLLVRNVPSEFTSDKDQIILEGTTTTGATVSINAEPIFVKSDGSFSQEVQLSPGVNEIVIQAKNRADNATRQIVKVLYNQGLAKVNETVKTE